MKKIITIAAFTTLAGISQATEKQISPYISISGGMSVLDDYSVTDSGMSANLSFDDGAVYSAAIGIESVNASSRIELEYSYQKNDLDELSIMGINTPFEGDTTINTGMINYYFDFKNGTAFTPFVKAGLGFAEVELTLDTSNSGGDKISMDETVFAYQIGAGLGYAATEHITLDLEYNYLTMQDPDLEGLEIEVDIHQLMVGLRYTF